MQVATRHGRCGRAGCRRPVICSIIERRNSQIGDRAGRLSQIGCGAVFSPCASYASGAAPLGSRPRAARIAPCLGRASLAVGAADHADITPRPRGQPHGGGARSHRLMSRPCTLLRHKHLLGARRSRRDFIPSAGAAGLRVKIDGESDPGAESVPAHAVILAS